jgi:hypothetical protein
MLEGEVVQVAVNAHQLTILEHRLPKKQRMMKVEEIPNKMKPSNPVLQIRFPFNLF